jgi:hypothetical protein
MRLAGSMPCLNHRSPVYSGALIKISGGFMDSTSQTAKWTPYEIKAASIVYERRSEDLQLQQLRIRLEKKMQEAENRASTPTAA